MDAIIIANQILILGVLIAIGAFATRIGVINENLKEGIARLVFNITLPLMLFTNFMHLDITPGLLRNGANVLGLSLTALLLLLLTGILSSRLQGLAPRKKSIHTLHTLLGNTVFLGFPLTNALFPGGDGLFYATLFFILSSTMMWTLGIYIMTRAQNPNLIKNLRHLINPNTIAFALGILLMLFGIRLPGVLDTSLTGLGSTTNYLSMLYIGAMLAQISIKGVLTRRSVYVLCFNKLLLVPFVMILLTSFLINTLNIELNHVARSVVVMQTGMPAMAVVVVLARRFGADDLLATENLFTSTILSLATLPFLYFLIGLVG